MFYVYVPEGEEPTYPFTLTDLRRLHPNVSWPVEIDAATAAEFSCFVVTPTDAPIATGKRAERTAPVQINGEWVEQWVLVDYTADEIEQQWYGIRADRNGRLAACDWTQLPDAPLTNVQTSEWATYRQALRDITDTADPFAVVWPDAPKP
jgi:hypothetical protein